MQPIQNISVLKNLANKSKQLLFTNHIQISSYFAYNHVICPDKYSFHKDIF